MITLECLSFPETAEGDDPHVQCACIVDNVRRRLRYAQRIVECPVCEDTIAEAMVHLWDLQDGLMAHGSITINELERITGRTT